VNNGAGEVNATALAAHLGYSKARISQLVASGRLDGCWTGQGRDRRFDADACAARLTRELDPGQQLGNGLIAYAARASIATPPQESQSDAQRLARARADAAEIELAQARRRFAADEGRWVLAAEVARAQRAVAADSLAVFEQFLLDEVRRIASALLAADPAAMAQASRARWRAARAARAGELEAAADAVTPQAAESADLADA